MFEKLPKSTGIGLIGKQEVGEQLEAVAAIKARDDGGLGQRNGPGNQEKRGRERPL